VGEANERTREARRLIVQAAGEHVDQFEGWEGSICTAFVTILELHSPEGHRCCIWFTGNGVDPGETHDEGLDSWRVEGMVRKVLRDLDSRNVTAEDE
jgi:hypothetical protein